jgi:hypothetical protein
MAVMEFVNQEPKDDPADLTVADTLMSSSILFTVDPKALKTLLIPNFWSKAAVLLDKTDPSFDVDSLSLEMASVVSVDVAASSFSAGRANSSTAQGSTTGSLGSDEEAANSFTTPVPVGVRGSPTLGSASLIMLVVFCIVEDVVQEVRIENRQQMTRRQLAASDVCVRQKNMDMHV